MPSRFDDYPIHQTPEPMGGEQHAVGPRRLVGGARA